MTPRRPKRTTLNPHEFAVVTAMFTALGQIQDRNDFDFQVPDADAQRAFHHAYRYLNRMIRGKRPVALDVPGAADVNPFPSYEALGYKQNGDGSLEPVGHEGVKSALEDFRDRDWGRGVRLKDVLPADLFERVSAAVDGVQARSPDLSNLGKAASITLGEKRRSQHANAIPEGFLWVTPHENGFGKEKALPPPVAYQKPEAPRVFKAPGRGLDLGV